MRSLRVGLVLTFCASLCVAQEGIRGAKRPGPIKPDEFNDRPKVEPRKGGEIVEGVSVGFRSLDPYQDTSATTSESIHGYVEEALVGDNPE
ncbi:MAG TPA: hypothetical protein VM222_06070, partial [Planctomycetota bacterium]|nr:hypothetical protein [Planctomycetota bacterium]